MDIDQPEQAEDTGPWAWPRWMLGEILQLHDLGDLLTRGLTRRAASMLARFLWSTEAIVRRLLLAAAFGLKVASKERTAPSPRQPKKTQTETEPDEQPAQVRVSFRTFAIRSAPGTAAQTGGADRALVLRPDLGVLPLDPLLRIGAEALPPRKTAGRRSRRAARFRPPLSAEEEERRYCLQKDRLNAAYDLPSRPMPSRPQHSPLAQGRSRRRYFEDRPNPFDDPKRRPAPMLARRITALIRVLENPEAATQRLAAMLARRTPLAGRFLGIGCPTYTRRPTDNLPRPPGLVELLLARDTLAAALPLNDTS